MPQLSRTSWPRWLNGRLAFRLGLSIFALWILLASRTLRAGAGLFPTWASGACLLFLVVDTFRTWRRDAAPEPGPQRPMTVIFGAVAGYVVAMYLVGFYISTAVMLLALPLLIGNIKRRYILLSGALVLAGIWLVFDKLLLIPLPPGVLLQ